MADGFTNLHRVPIIMAAARNNVPAVYVNAFFAREGGLLSYGGRPGRQLASRRLLYRSHSARRKAGLPVQLPTKFEMVVNRKTATALGLAIPPSILLRADEVID
jgi:putative ABC transport system substrate-binding protein